MNGIDHVELWLAMRRRRVAGVGAGATRRPVWRSRRERMLREVENVAVGVACVGTLMLAARLALEWWWRG